jgi:probable F420-dependent oxidoreductase
MRFGFIPTEGGRYYREFLEEVLLGEELGFDSVWLEEHHGVRDHYWPSPLTALAGAATRTERIALGTDVIVLPFYHPVRVAEDAAQLQIMSGGRFILGAAIGYKPDEFALYGVALERRGERFAEAIELIRRLWTEDEVDFEGRHLRLAGARIEPRPDRAPPIWIGGWGPRSLERAARLGDAWIPGPTADLARLLDAQASYRTNLLAAGIDPADRPAPLTRDVVIAPSDAQAREVAERHLLVAYRDEYGGGTWAHPFIGDDDPASLGQLDELGRDRFLVGSPETICREIARYREAFGVDHLVCRLYFPGLPHELLMAELRLLARDVIPAFR